MTSDLLSNLIYKFSFLVSLNQGAATLAQRGKDINDASVPKGESGQEAGGVSSFLVHRMVDYRVRNN